MTMGIFCCICGRKYLRDFIFPTTKTLLRVRVLFLVRCPFVLLSMLQSRPSWPSAAGGWLLPHWVMLLVSLSWKIHMLC